ncbi:MAG: F0F1 ATP synthase subunit gamma [Gammaproteobacteria bacterium]|jgi:F-type H+-transporting ATPase subunit gamma|nr:F0F1 ATP synthase subunit gamma [Gammaproteobacteria bacterium]MDP6617667.1 F0F1 ATP synthase subunit gamma [Gammaproteobacteria bacterium]MDP6694369.1 F0F1 ATP synthase subunit gamma [Gammaproteobacteria bacterium]
MSNLKEIRTKIGSVKNTQKITAAMEMVAASKLRRTQDRMRQTRPFADKIRTAIGHLYKANPEYKHPYLVERDIKRVGYIVITTDRGLCGGLNVNEFRMLLNELREWKSKGVEADLCLLGSKGVQFFRSLDVNVVGATSNIGENPSMSDLIASITMMLEAFETGGEEGGIDSLFLVHNRFDSTMSQKPQSVTLIPVEAPDAEELPQHWDYIYEPEATELLTSVLQRYIESQVYRGTVENVACEMAAKMVAMKSATDNAGKLIDNLQLDYNKARQAAITQEISEIVGGAAAVSE